MLLLKYSATAPEPIAVISIMACVSVLAAVKANDTSCHPVSEPGNEVVSRTLGLLVLHRAALCFLFVLGGRNSTLGLEHRREVSL